MDDIITDKYGGGTEARFGAPAAIEDQARVGLGRQAVRSPVGLEAVVWASPVFVLGRPRSGTTLVQTMLDSHSRLSVLYEADALVDVPLGLQSCLVSASEALTLAEAHPASEGRNFDVRTARAVCEDLGITDAAGAMRVLAASQAFAQGKKRWGNKATHAVPHLAELAIVYPDAQFIHVIRDGRDVASSEARLFETSVVKAALLWRTAVRIGRRAESRLGPDRYLEVRLEELLSSPEEQIRRMCSFLGEDFDQSMLHFNTTARERIPPTLLTFHPRLGEPPRPLPPSRGSAETGLQKRAAAALIDAELVELRYVAVASSGRCRRIVHVIIGYTFALLPLRKSLLSLFHHFACSFGARRAAGVITRQAVGRQIQGGTLPRPAATPATCETLDQP